MILQLAGDTLLLAENGEMKREASLCKPNLILNYSRSSAKLSGSSFISSGLVFEINSSISEACFWLVHPGLD